MLRFQFLALVVSLSTPLCGLLQGCGGGVETVEAEKLMARANAGIRIEGCVVDQHFIPHEGIAVRALSADGRMLAHATSGRRGELVVSVPAGAAVTLVVDGHGGESMSLPAHDRDSVLESCLVAHTTR